MHTYVFGEKVVKMRTKPYNILTLCKQQLATVWTDTGSMAGSINLFMQIQYSRKTLHKQPGI